MKPAKRMKKSKIFVFLIALFLLFTGAFVALPLPGQVPVLMYHFVGSKQDALDSKNFVSNGALQAQMSFLKHFGYRPISIADYEAIRTGQRKPRGREILITFDDGNESFYTQAYSILKPFEFPVTLFIVSQSIKESTNGSMSEATLKELQQEKWISLQSHTKTHPFLSELDDVHLADELSGSKSDLEQMFGRPFPYLAYPSGDVDARVVDAAQKAGYRLAFTTAPKKLKRLRSGPYTISRVKISEGDLNPFLFWIKVSGLYNFYKSQTHRLKQTFASAR